MNYTQYNLITPNNLNIKKLEQIKKSFKKQESKLWKSIMNITGVKIIEIPYLSKNDYFIGVGSEVAKFIKNEVVKAS